MAEVITKSVSGEGEEPTMQRLRDEHAALLGRITGAAHWGVDLGHVAFSDPDQMAPTSESLQTANFAMKRVLNEV